MSDTPRWLYAAYRSNLRRGYNKPRKPSRVVIPHSWISWPAYSLAYAMESIQKRRALQAQKLQVNE